MGTCFSMSGEFSAAQQVLAVCIGACCTIRWAQRQQPPAASSCFIMPSAAQYCAPTWPGMCRRDRGPLREDEARRFLQQLVIGLDYCHRMGVVNRQASSAASAVRSLHCSCSNAVSCRPLEPTEAVCCRDIKLENALLDRNKRLLKITDFGYAKTAADSLPKSEVGTPNYAGALPTSPARPCQLAWLSCKLPLRCGVM